MSRLGVLALPETIRTLAFGSITAAYTSVQTPFSHPLRAFRLINDTNGKVMFSIDATNDHFFVPDGSFVLYDISANMTPEVPLRFGSNVQWSVKYITAPSTGSVYIEGIYAKGE